MDAETQAHIFEPYFSRKAGGHGIGLSVVYGIVKRCRGSISVHSEPGAGATFIIALPRAPRPNPCVDAAASHPARLPDRGAACRRICTRRGSRARQGRRRSCSRSLRPRVVAAGRAVVVVVAASGLWARQRLQHEVERALAAELGAVLDTATHGLLGFMENCERLAGRDRREPRGAGGRACRRSRSPGRRRPRRRRSPARSRLISPRASSPASCSPTQRGAVLATSRRVRARGRSAAAGRAARRGDATPGPPHRRASRFAMLEGRVRVVVAAPIRDAPAILGLLPRPPAVHARRCWRRARDRPARPTPSIASGLIDLDQPLSPAPARPPGCWAPTRTTARCASSCATRAAI